MASETDATFAIITALMREKGYQPGDFTFEEKRADITVRTGEHNDFLIEMKRADVDLTMQHVMQAIRYGHKTRTRIVIITNGRQWLYYDALRETPIDFGAYKEEIPHRKDVAAWTQGIIDQDLDWASHQRLNTLRRTKDKVTYLVNHPELCPILQTVPHRGSYDWAILLEYLNAFCDVDIPEETIRKIVTMSQPDKRNDPAHIPPADTIRRTFYAEHKTDIIPQAISGRDKRIP